MATNSGFFNEHTGHPGDGNFYCQACGDQVSVGFKHHHASEVPDLKKRIAELERQLATAKDSDVGVRNHWDDLGRQLREYMRQVSDVRLDELYHKLFAAGWAEGRPFPLSTSNADHEIRYQVLKDVSIEIVERREGRIPSVK